MRKLMVGDELHLYWNFGGYLTNIIEMCMWKVLRGFQAIAFQLRMQKFFNEESWFENLFF